MAAKELRVSERSVERWRRAWPEGGIEGLRSAGPERGPKLSARQFTSWTRLGRGPVARASVVRWDKACIHYAYPPGAWLRLRSGVTYPGPERR
ncbi:helix-turn-helix domain-containing protein [Streptomyces sp. NPDC088354]|uniref:helix-turn-helix domain-containing protein n=1 Tax=Streptomyces sp. NPDC088354 TaxID=3365856 RepID=UPI0037F7DA32